MSRETKSCCMKGCLGFKPYAVLELVLAAEACVIALNGPLYKAVRSIERLALAVKNVRAR